MARKKVDQLSPDYVPSWAKDELAKEERKLNATQQVQAVLQQAVDDGIEVNVSESQFNKAVQDVMAGRDFNIASLTAESSPAAPAVVPKKADAPRSNAIDAVLSASPIGALGTLVGGALDSFGITDDTALDATGKALRAGVGDIAADAMFRDVDATAAEKIRLAAEQKKIAESKLPEPLARVLYTDIVSPLVSKVAGAVGNTGAYKGAFGGLSEYVENSRKEVEAEVNEVIARNPVQGYSERIALDVAGSPQSLASIPGGLFAGIPALTTYNDAYRGAREAGAKPEAASDYATLQAGIEGGISAIPTGGIAAKIFKKEATALAKPIIGRTVRTGATAAGESVEEMTQAGAADLVNRATAATTDDKSLEAFAAANVSKNLLGDVLRAGGAGLGGGGVFGGFHASVEYAAEQGRQAADSIDKTLEIGFADIAKKGEREGLEAKATEEDKVRQDTITAASKMADIIHAEFPNATTEEKRAVFEQRWASGDVDTWTKTPAERAAEAKAKEDQAKADVVDANLIKFREQAAKEEAEKEAEKARRATEKASGKRRAQVADEINKEFPDASPEEKVRLFRERMSKPAEDVALEEKVVATAKKVEATKKAAATKAENAKIRNTVKANPEATPEEVANVIKGQKTEKPAPTDATISDIAEKLNLGMKGSLGRKTTDGEEGNPDRTYDEKKYVSRVKKIVTNLVKANRQDTADVQNLIRQGKLKLVPNPQSVGRDDDKNDAEYDTETGQMYLYTDRVNPDDVVAVMSHALHEATHAGQFNDRAGRSSVLKHLMGGDKFTKANSIIHKAANNGNKIAQQAVDKAKEESPNAAIEELEVVPYFVTAATEARGGTLGQLRGTANDIVASAKSFLRDKMGVNLDVSLNDLASASKKTAGEIVKTTITAKGDGKGSLGMIAGPKAKSFYTKKANDKTYKGAVDRGERFEIADNEAELIIHPELMPRTHTILSDVLDHDILYKEYPWLENYNIVFDDQKGGYGSHDWRNETIHINEILLKNARNAIDPKVRMNNAERMRSTVLHEVQHAIQSHEGFIDGANAQSFIPKAAKERIDKARATYNEAVKNFDLGRAVKTLPPETKRVWQNQVEASGHVTRDAQASLFLEEGYAQDSADRMINRAGQLFANIKEQRDHEEKVYHQAEKKAFDTYVRNYGEAEARNTEARSRLTPDQLAAKKPESTFVEAEHKVPVERTMDTTGLAYENRPAESTPKTLGARGKVLTDEAGNPITLYRGGSQSSLKPREGYAVFSSTSPHVAASYADKDNNGRVVPFHVKADQVIEFPVKVDRFGGNSFDKVEFDRMAKRLQPGQVLVARQVYDYGPFADPKADPDKLYSYASDIYAFGEGTETVPVPKTLGARGNTDTKAFKEWFGNSVTVDENGEPKVYYSGTSKDKDFTSFNIPKNGAWFTTSADEASMYAKDNDSKKMVRDDGPGKSVWALKEINTASRVFPVYIRAEKPYYLTEADKKAMDRQGYKAAQGQLFDRLRAQGYDSAFFDKDGVVIAVLNDPTQIKGVFNKGEFSNKKKDVLGARGKKADGDVGKRVAPAWFTGLFDQAQGTGKEVNELIEFARSSPAETRMIAEAQLAKYNSALNKLARSMGMTPSELNDEITAKLDKVDGKSDSYDENRANFKEVTDQYGDAGEALLRLRDQIDALTFDILKQRAATGKPLSAKEKKLYGTLFNNLGRYAHRQYAVNAGKIGQDYAKSVWDAYEKENKGKGNKKTKELHSRVADAVNYLVDNNLAIPEDLDAIGQEQTENLYATWVGPTRGVSLEDMKEALDVRRDTLKPEEIKAEAESITKELLGLTSTDSLRPMTQSYRGGKQNDAILKERKNLPPELRKLMGEITDPGMQLMLTAGKQAEFVARNKMLLDLTQQVTKDIQPPHATGTKAVIENNMTKLEGEQWGPMEGYYVSPNMRALIGDTVQQLATFEQAIAMAGHKPSVISEMAAGRALAGWGKIVGVTKRLQIIWNPVNFAYNFVGAPRMMLSNGNLNPKHAARALQSSVELIANAMNPKVATPEAIRLNKVGVTDSAFIGELKQAEYRQLRNLVKEMSGKSPSEAFAWLQTQGAGVTELYAMMDVWSKVANFYQQVNVLTDFYKKNGDAKTAEEIDREAADIVNRTNITYKRAAPLVKAMERNGLTQFGTYFYEVFRSEVGNAMQGIDELKRAGEAKTPEAARAMALQGGRRLTGQATAWYLTAKTAQVLAMLGLDMFGDDDEDERASKALLPDFVRTQDLVKMGKDKDGNDVLFNISRLDPVGPITDIMRAALAGEDPEQIKKSLFNLYIAPRVGPQLLKAVQTMADRGARPFREPTVQQVAPNFYSGILQAANQAGLDDRQTKAWTNVAETFLPGAVNAYRDTNPKAVTGDHDTVASVLQYLGGSMYKIDPAKAAKGPAMDYSDTLKEGRKDIAEIFKDHPEGLPEAELLSRLTDLRTEEREAFDKAQDVYNAMLAHGLSKRKAAVVLKDAGLDAAAIGDIRNNSFHSRMISENSLRTFMTNELKGKDKQERIEIKAKWKEAMSLLKVARRTLEAEEE